MSSIHREQVRRGEDGYVKIEAEIRTMKPEPRTAWSHQKMQGAERSLSLWLSEGEQPYSRRENVFLIYKPYTFWLFVVGVLGN